MQGDFIIISLLAIFQYSFCGKDIKMNKYKKSYYNYYFKTGENIVIFNSLTGQISQLLELEAALFDCDVNAYEPHILNLEKENELREKGIVIDFEVNEKKIIEKLYLDYIHHDELFLIILPTEQCNLRCVYCYEKFI